MPIKMIYRGFFGGKQELINAMIERASRISHNSNCVCFFTAFRPLTEEETRCRSDIRDAAPDICHVFVLSEQENGCSP